MSGPAEHYQAAIATIRNAVVDYREGLARIDREFDAACERIDNSIVDLNQYGAKTGRAQTDAKQRERHLRQQENAVTRQLATTDEKIAQANDGLAAAMSGIRALATEKSTLEKQISDRWLIVSLYYYFAEESDEAKKRCRTLQSQLDSATSRKAAFERTKGEFETIRRQEETRRAKLQATLDEIRWEIAALEKSRGLHQEQSRRLSEERQNADAQRQLRRANWLSRKSSGPAKSSAGSNPRSPTSAGMILRPLPQRPMVFSSVRSTLFSGTFRVFFRMQSGSRFPRPWSCRRTTPPRDASLTSFSCDWSRQSHPGSWN
jgi:predicted  nucleic acid-binding Zn-ribbon protein